MQLPLDHNFPEPIVGALKPLMGPLELLPIRQIDDRLTGLDDRPLLIALRQLGFEGLVTLNYRMLRNPSELAAIIKTGLTVFAIEGVGHDPLRATGALLLDLLPARVVAQSVPSPRFRRSVDRRPAEALAAQASGVGSPRPEWRWMYAEARARAAERRP